MQSLRKIYDDFGNKSPKSVVPIGVISGGRGGPDPHFLEWGDGPPLYKYSWRLVPQFSDQSYATGGARPYRAAKELSPLSLNLNISLSISRIIFTSLPTRVRNIVISADVYVCLSALVSQKQRVQTLHIFLLTCINSSCMRSTGDNAICHVLPILLIT